MAIIASDSLALLESRLSAARAGYLDNLSVGAVALDSKMDIVDTNVDTLLTRLSASRAGYLDNLNTPFANVYEGNIVILASATTATVTITAVDQTKSLLFFTGLQSNTSGMSADDDLAQLYFSSDTGVRGERSAAPSTTVGVRFRVMEWA